MSVIQDLIDAASPGTIVTVPPGEYIVDVAAPITLKSDITLDLSGVTLKVAPNNTTFAIPVQITGDVHNVTLLNGTIIGDRATHLPGGDTTVGPGGGLIGIGLGATNIKVQGAHLIDGFADGMMINGANTIEYANIISDHHSRNGLTIANSIAVLVHDSQFSNMGGAPPGDGIDVENDLDTQVISGVLITKCAFGGMQGSDISFGAPGIYHSCEVAPDNSFDKKSQPIWVAGNAGSLGLSWWAYLLHLTCGWMPWYRWWGYPTSWSN